MKMKVRWRNLVAQRPAKASSVTAVSGSSPTLTAKQILGGMDRVARSIRGVPEVGCMGSNPIFFGSLERQIGRRPAQGGSNPLPSTKVKNMKTIKDKQYSFDHVNKRLKERFNAPPLEMDIYDDVCDLLKTNKSAMVIKENDDQEIHDMIYFGKRVSFVFSNKRGYITTVIRRQK